MAAQPPAQDTNKCTLQWKVKMVRLAVVIAWSGEPSCSALVERMLDVFPHQDHQRHVLTPERGVALGLIERKELALASAESARTWCVANLRLDNRQELHEVLCGKDHPPLPDSQLLVLGYERWGTDLADHLRGDFAFVIWDSDRRCLYAARDPFGVRLLYYHAGPDRLIVASEIGQLVVPGVVGGRLEDRVVLDYLRTEHHHAHETMFRDIFRVLPGHWLLATCNGPRQQRYWHPPAKEIRFARRADYPREFGRLFRRAVGDRLDAEHPQVAQMSGGLDSSAIVCMADDIIGHGSGDRPKVHVCSAVYPGLECDETPWIDTVARKIRLPTHRWNGANPAPLEPSEPWIAYPWEGGSPSSLEGDLKLALQIGASAILSGFGGDELLFEGGVFQDLAADGRWLALLENTLLAPGIYAAAPPTFFLLDAIRKSLPGVLRRGYRHWRPRPVQAPPEWLSQRLRDLWRNEALPLDPSGNTSGRCATQQFTWRWLTRPHTVWSIELHVIRAAHHGLEVRFPYLDRRLADFVLAVPYAHRLPRGRMKLLLREAMKGLLPRPIIDRRRVTGFQCLAPLEFSRHREQLRALLWGERWLCEPYVEQKVLRKIFERVDKDPFECSNCQDVRCVQHIAQLELWLRALTDRGIL
jgi:asparagine synthase (glutamine-hydrolysing)